MKKIISIILVAAIVGVSIYYFIGSKKQEVGYRSEVVETGDIISTVSATGNVNAVKTVLVGTQVSGTIQEIYVDFNSTVKKGQLIAQIDPSLLESQVAQSKANILVAQANLKKAEVSLTNTKRTFDRNKELYDKQLIARSDYDTAETNYEQSKAEVNAVQAQITQLQALYKNSITNLHYAKIVSPVDGVVISRDVDVGQVVAASFQTPTLFTIAQDLTKMEIHVNVDEADIGQVKEGQDVEFTVDSYPETKFIGTVWQVRNSPTTVENVVTYDVVVKVDNNELKLKPGMTANVSILVNVRKNVLKIPNAALRFNPFKGDKTQKLREGQTVWILDKMNKMKLVPVSVVTGICDENYTELISGELQQGQELVVESLNQENSKKSNNNPGPPGPPGMF